MKASRIIRSFQAAQLSSAFMPKPPLSLVVRTETHLANVDYFKILLSPFQRLKVHTDLKFQKTNSERYTFYPNSFAGWTPVI